jgi:hypothetical protein
MSKKTRPLEHVKRDLQGFIDRCNYLIENLGSMGRPLNNDELYVLRAATYPHLTDCLNKIGFFYLQGSSESLEHTLDDLHDLIFEFNKES